MQTRLPISFLRPSNASLAAGISFFTALYFYLPLMTIYLFQRGLDLFQVSAMSSLIVAVQFLAEIPTGVLADRWGRKPSWVLAVSLQLAGEVWFFFARAFWEFACISILAGLGYAFASGAVEALIYDTLPEQDRETLMKQAMGKIIAAQLTGNLLAYLTSGWILAQPNLDHFALAIAMTAGSVGVGWALTLLVFEPKRQASPSPRRVDWLGTFRSGLELLHSSSALRRISLLMILSDPFSFYLIAYYQPYFHRAGVPSAWFGPTLAAGSLLAALASRYAFRIEARVGKRLGLLAATSLPGFIYLLMAPIQQLWLVVGLVLLQNGVMYTARPLLRAYVNEYIDSDVRATVLSTIQLFSSVYLALMGLLLGWIGDRSLPALFGVMGMVVLAGAFLFRVREPAPAAV